VNDKVKLGSEGGVGKGMCIFFGFLVISRVEKLSFYFFMFIISPFCSQISRL